MDAFRSRWFEDYPVCWRRIAENGRIMECGNGTGCERGVRWVASSTMRARKRAVSAFTPSVRPMRSCSRSFRTMMSQTVNAFDVEDIIRLQTPEQPLIHGAVKILPRLLVHIDVPGVDVQRRQRIQLTILSLFLCAHACIAKNMICQSIVLQAFFNSLQKNVQKNYRTTDRQSK